MTTDNRVLVTTLHYQDGSTRLVGVNKTYQGVEKRIRADAAICYGKDVKLVEVPHLDEWAVVGDTKDYYATLFCEVWE